MGEWIMAFFGDSIALLTFFSIFAAGMVFTIFSLLFGGDADHGDADLGGDHGDFDGDHGGDHDGPGLFSVRGISLLLGGFGGVAFITMYFTDKVVVSSVVGLIAGFPFALACMAFYRLLARQESDSMVHQDDFVGASGTVVTSIPEGGLGEVTLLVKGQQISKSAVSDGRMAIGSGTPVRVTSYLGDRVVVELLKN